MERDQPGLEVHGSDYPEVDRRHQQPLYAIDSDPAPKEQSQGDVQYMQPTDEPTSSEPKERRRICGVSRGHFWIIVAVVALTVVIAAVGGGVGGALAGKNNSNAATSTSDPSGTTSGTPSSTNGNASSTSQPASTSDSTATTGSTSSTTSPTSSAVPSTGLLSLDCPTIDKTNTTITMSGYDYLFQYRCGYDASSSSIKTTTTWTIDDCARECGQYNSIGNAGDCEGVTWNGNLTSSIASQGGNCFLKFGSIELSYCGDTCPLAAAAVLKT